MVIVQVQVRVKPECITAFREASIANAGESVREPGIARFDVMQNTEDPERFVLLEVYRTTEDTARHKETEHYRTWRDTVEEMMAEPRRRETYSSVFPASEDW